MNETPVLSICIPTYNRARVLARSLEFHLHHFARLGFSFEMVIANDCSTDGTDELLAAHAGDPRVKVFRRHRNAGFLDNYAFTLQRAQGRYVVFLGDDDLLVPDQIASIVARMDADETIGMWQAPWMLVDERPGGGPMRPFYHLPRQMRFEAGDFAGLLDFILSRHVFPEFNVLRRSLVPAAISLTPAFIFWPFLYVGRVLAHAAIVFDPTPFANVTAISDDPLLQQGNKETMREWDRYRGGLEFIASQADRDDPDAFRRRFTLAAQIHSFMTERMRVALRLLMNDLQWPDAYILHHRLAAYGGSILTPDQKSRLAIGAAVTTCVQEALGLADAPIVMDPGVDDSILGLLRPQYRQKVGRHAPAGSEAPTYITYSADFDRSLPHDARRLHLRDYLFQFDR